MAHTPAGRLGIAQRPRHKKRRFNDFQDVLLSDPHLISPMPLMQTPPQRAIAPLPSQPPSSKDSNKASEKPEIRSNSSLKSFIISTTVKENTSVVEQVAPHLPSNITTPAGGVTANQDGCTHQPDVFHVPGTEQFQGDPILVEDSPTCVQPEEEEEEAGTPDTRFDRRSKNGAQYRRDKLKQRSQQFLLHLYDHENGPEDLTASYYDTLALFTDPVETRMLPNCYSQFLSCTREWKVIEAFMRSCSQNGIDLGTGEATVKCAMCPIPGVNIPQDWNKDPDADLLYRVFESFDGNFSLQLNDKGVTEAADPSIIGDSGYWVEESFSHQYLEALGGFEDRRGGANPGQGLNTAFLTYDIWCKYSINLENRLAAGNAPSLSDLGLQVLGGIPKFHIGAHGAGCYPKYSLNFMKNVGRTHGERVEQAWSDLGRAKYITREMTPGHRKDTLNTMFSHHNWKILCKEDMRLSKAIHTARKEICQKEQDLKTIEISLGIELVSEFMDWDLEHPEVEKYCSNYKDLNPPPRAALLRRLHAEETATWEQSSSTLSPEEISTNSPAVFISLALDLELQRDRLEDKASQASKSDSTKSVSDWISAKTRFKTALTNHYNQLRFHAPLLSDYELTVPNGDHLHTATLHLPSGFVAVDQQKYKLESLGKVEQQLRIAQAQEEVINLRNALGVKAFLIREGRQTSTTGGTGYGVSSRSQGRVQQANEQVNRIANRYRRTYAALIKLGTKFGIGTEAGALQELTDDDLKIGSNWTVEEVSTGKKNRPKIKSTDQPIPWIWKTFGGNLVSKDDDQDNVAAKIEEYNHQARADLSRWQEEEKLLKEELRRLGVYFCWKATELETKRDKQGVSAGFQAWLEKKRRMWGEMAQRAEHTKNKVDEMISSGQW
ncbi:hypothetical protein FRC01_002908 [Tulasnella sp. 417]|nr:hypothetical protein FRC01_002908 [Tulasnella sp. 417]